MTSIIEKRRSLHTNLTRQKQRNDALEMQMSQLQALANIGTMTCMIAHEINNLLTPLSNYATLAMNNPDDKMLTEKALSKTQKNCLRASTILASMLALINGETKNKQPVQLKKLVEEIFECFCRDFSKDGITVRLDICDDFTIWAVPIQIQQVLMNLILNARQAMLARGGSLEICADETEDNYLIEVSDTGCGIEPVDMNRIFKPFFTTSKRSNPPAADSGSGLGLTFCKKVVSEHAGSIDVTSKPDHGTTFTITLPKAAEGIS